MPCCAVQVNDVRSGGERITWWLHLGFELASGECRAVSKYWLRHPASVVNLADPLARYDAPNKPAWTWWSGTMPHTGTMLRPWVHAHRARYGGVLLLATAAEDLHLTCDEVIYSMMLHNSIA